MPFIDIPESVRYLISRLQQNGYRAYAVGGCVRDSLLQKTPDDWDICTSALPQQTLDTLQMPNIIENGLRHGTVTIRYQGQNYEITTFRTDGAYVDNRRPSSVTFVADVKEDLLRRDFTINALAYNDQEGLIDYFNGREDLQQGIIRCVGNADERFQEDGLRIMRALRFASRFGFHIASDTAAAIHRNAELLKNISAERIHSELDKLLIGQNAEAVLSEFSDVLAVVIPEITPMIGFDQRNPHHAFDVWTHTVKAVANTPPERILRLAALFHDIGKPSAFTLDEKGVGHFKRHAFLGEEITHTVLRRLRYDNRTIAQVSQLVLLHDDHPSLKNKSVRRFLSKTGENLWRELLQLQKADFNAKGVPVTEEAAAYFDKLYALCVEEASSQTAYTLKRLAVNGKDLIALGIKDGMLIGQILSELLECVIEGTLTNEREILLEKAREIAARGR